jgi:hypothetical protein
MPSRQTHRGQHQEDATLFHPKRLPALRDAVADLSFLLTRGYADKASLKLVGDHHQLALRQRRAIRGAACSDASLERRRQHAVDLSAIAGRRLIIDGYNLLIIIESALSAAVLIRGRDRCIRDLASIHGSYRKVAETVPALEAIGATLEHLRPERVTWLFDAPVSNSGRLKTLIGSLAEERGWPWTVHLKTRVDQLLATSHDTVVTADGWILDRAAQWTNLREAVLHRIDPPPPILDLSE